MQFALWRLPRRRRASAGAADRRGGRAPVGSTLVAVALVQLLAAARWSRRARSLDVGLVHEIVGGPGDAAHRPMAADRHCGRVAADPTSVEVPRSALVAGGELVELAIDVGLVREHGGGPATPPTTHRAVPPQITVAAVPLPARRWPRSPSAR